MTEGHGRPVGLASVVTILVLVMLVDFLPHSHELVAHLLQEETSQSTGQSVGHQVSNSESLGLPPG
jgi:hypothetical protein